MTDLSSQHMTGKKLILLDRDGVINRDLPDSVKSIADFELIAGVAAAIARLNRQGLKVVVVTNQAVVGRGTLTLDELAAIHQEMERRLWEDAKAVIDRIFFAPDAPAANGDWRATPRRKPGPQMLQEAMAEFNQEPSHTLMVGDSYTDFVAACRAGCEFWLVETGKGLELKKSLDRDAGLAEELRSTPICRDLTAVVDRLGIAP
ncbi:MAG: HAD-IIIA family hydrolase [Candidatus Pacebacteria bacterium]|nr:HAD-IIIA family hydrolase [Candidatus Paceibacterota bacterium]